MATSAKANTLQEKATSSRLVGSKGSSTTRKAICPTSNPIVVAMPELVLATTDN